MSTHIHSCYFMLCSHRAVLHNHLIWDDRRKTWKQKVEGLEVRKRLSISGFVTNCLLPWAGHHTFAVLPLHRVVRGLHRSWWSFTHQYMWSIWDLLALMMFLWGMLASLLRNMKVSLVSYFYLELVKPGFTLCKPGTIAWLGLSPFSLGL